MYLLLHYNVIKWKHFPRNWPFVRGIHRSLVNSPHKGQWRGALMFSLICVWRNDWENNREDGDLRRYRAHYDVIIMISIHATIMAASRWIPVTKGLAPVPLSIFRSNSKFDENSECSSFEYTRPITTIFCTRHDSDTVVTCAKYRCDRPRILYTRVFWIFIEFRIRSKYA